MNQQLFSYNQEIQPIIREILQQKELLKDFVDSDEECIQHAGFVKEAQEDLKSIILKSERGAELLEKIKDLEKDLKLATKAAVRGTKYKAADFKGYSVARAKASVEKVTAKGELFSELEKELT